MTPERRALLGALALLALVALVLHAAVHPVFAPEKELQGATVFRGSFVAATLLPFLDFVAVTWLFRKRPTAVLAYLLNGLLVVYGTVLMGHYGIAALAAKRETPADWLFRSNSIDIALAWADFLVGKALYESWLREG